MSADGTKNRMLYLKTKIFFVFYKIFFAFSKMPVHFSKSPGENRKTPVTFNKIFYRFCKVDKLVARAIKKYFDNLQKVNQNFLEKICLIWLLSDD